MHATPVVAASNLARRSKIAGMELNCLISSALPFKVSFCADNDSAESPPERVTSLGPVRTIFTSPFFPGH